MSDIELGLSGAKQIEALLEGQFGAVGRGLHEKLTSVERSIPGDLRNFGVIAFSLLHLMSRLLAA